MAETLTQLAPLRVQMAEELRTLRARNRELEAAANTAAIRNTAANTAANAAANTVANTVTNRAASV